MDVEKICKGWCIPLFIHIGLSIIQLLFVLFKKTYDDNGKKVTYPLSIRMIIFGIVLVWDILIGILLYYLCKHCHQGWAWVIILLPIILSFIMFVFIFIAAVSVASKFKRLDNPYMQLDYSNY